MFCHRPDPITPIEEVVRGFTSAIERGFCFYWATSEWSAVQLLQAKAAADRLGLIPPCADQPEYSLLTRGRVEIEYAPLYRRAEQGGMGLGLTTWSPLASGVLTGKYGKEVPAGSRLASKAFKMRPDYGIFMKRVKQAEQLRPVAERLGCTMGQLALAWCIANPHVSTVITGATDPSQIDEQLGALPVVDRLAPGVMKEIDAALGAKVVEVAKRPRPAMPSARTARLSAGARAKL